MFSIANQYMTKILLAVTLTGISISLQAASVSGTATANVVTPISISATATTMDFGDVAVGTTGGTVVLTTTGTRSVTGDASALATTAGTAALFNVTGNGAATYSISFSASATLENAGGQQMTVNNFTHDAGASPALSGGTGSFNVGATLNISGSQATGVYSTATGAGVAYTVTVNYN